MESCVVCNIQTSKYKCPKCYSRYCSVSCCKTHKESCTKVVTTPAPETPKVSEVPTVPNYPLWAGAGTNGEFLQGTETEDDTVSKELLNGLVDNEEVRSHLLNPHLRAMMENMVNSENPSLDMAKAMQEPIFVEFANSCLKVVDKDNQT